MERLFWRRLQTSPQRGGLVRRTVTFAWHEPDQHDLMMSVPYRGAVDSLTRSPLEPVGKQCCTPGDSVENRFLNTFFERNFILKLSTPKPPAWLRKETKAWFASVHSEYELKTTTSDS
jgi:hypothetical protein